MPLGIFVYRLSNRSSNHVTIKVYISKYLYRKDYTLYYIYIACNQLWKWVKINLYKIFIYKKTCDCNYFGF